MKSKLWKLIHKWRDATTTESAWIARDQIDIELDKIEAAMTQEPVYGRYNAKIGMGESAKGYTYCHTPAHMDAWSAQQGATWEPLYLAAGAQPAQQEPVTWKFPLFPPQGFIDYIAANYSGEVIFSDPEWHAKRLWNSALRNAAPVQAVVKDSLTTQEPTPLEVRLVDTLLGQAQEPFAPDWAGYRQGKADGIAEAQERKPLPHVPQPLKDKDRK